MSASPPPSSAIAPEGDHKSGTVEKSTAALDDATITKRIREILTGANLETLSAKKIRLQLQEEFSVDLSDRKKEIDKLVLSILEEQTHEEAAQEAQAAQPPAKAGSIPKVDTKPKKPVEKRPSESAPREDKKKKAKGSDDDDTPAPRAGETDEEFAQRLQRESNSSRSLRSAAKPSRPAKKEKKAKSKKKVNSDDEDDDEAPVRKTGLHAPVIVSETLAEVIQTNESSRPQVVKKIWEYVRERSLQDETDKRFILCDEKLQQVFGCPRVSMFKMNKLLSSHLKRKDEVVS